MKRLLWLVIVVFVCAAPLAAQDEAVTEKTVVRNYLETVYNQMNLTGARQMLAVDFVMHDAVWGSTDTNGYVTNFRLFYDEVSDLRFTPYTLLQEGPLVAAAYLWEGQTRTGHPVSGNGMEFFRVVDGKIAEIWRKVEQHDFSVAGSAEDYRFQLQLTPMVTDLVYAPGAGMPEVTVKEPEYVSGAGMPEPAAQPEANSIVVRWIDSYNYGRLDTAVMTPDFRLHTCPCKNLGTIDLGAFTQVFDTMKASGTFQEWPQLLEREGYLSVTEGDLTAIQYDVDIGGVIPGGMTIFRLEDERIAEQWSF